MTSQWPVAFVAVLIAAAAVLGFMQHEQAAAASRGMAKAQAGPEAVPTEAAPEKLPAPEPKPAVLPAPSPALAAAPVAETRPPPTAQTVPAVRTTTVPAPPTKPVTPPVAAVNPAAALPADAGGQPKRESRAAVWAGLRTALQARIGVLPMDLAAGGYALSTDGVRVEAQPLPNWSVSLYNINPRTPEVETPNFKACLETTAAALGLDVTQKGVESDNGKTYLKTVSKVGNVSVVRDPANGNSCVIRPIQALVPQAPNPNQPVDLVAPKAPDRHKPAVPAVPIAPPKPPATDNNF
ncbi:MAG: hypothetical protein NTW87_19740 [Planctomycetota bacterium]|nr:hypothetical protein [Planctomycetota bacterium]